MSEFIHIEADFGNLYRALKQLEPEVRTQLRRELRTIATEVRDETRDKVPSGMKKAANAGVKTFFRGNLGAGVQVGGKTKPASWIGTAENGRWYHPIFPQAGSDRATWNWSHTPQANRHMLTSTWLQMGADIVARSNVAVQKAVDTSGMGER